MRFHSSVSMKALVRESDLHLAGLYFDLICNCQNRVLIIYFCKITTMDLTKMVNTFTWILAFVYGHIIQTTMAL